MVSSKLKDIGEGIVGAVLIVAAFLPPFLGYWRRWGATDAEVDRSLPGDDLVPQSKGGYTHAITIHASAVEVWPWLVQLGQGRGGFYSYDFLENLVGCNIHSIDKIIPEFQPIEIGDSVLMHPKNPYPYKVAAINVGRVLILLIRFDTQTGKAFELTDTMPDKYLNQSWVFFLDELNERTTRLISRSRNDWNRSLGNTLVFGIFGPISLVMQRKMLLGIRQRTEAASK